MAYFKENLLLKVFCFFKMPMMSFASPKIVTMTNDICVIKIKLNRRNKNPYKSLFLGSLATGADLATGISVIFEGLRLKKTIDFTIKSMQADFILPARSDTYFYVDQVQAIHELVQKAINNIGVRYEIPVSVVAKCPETTKDDVVAKFTMVLTMRYKQKR